MRSVHTLASVHSHLWGTSLPCLALGTPGSLNCGCVSFTLPPSCPPWLHGHYSLRSYYGDSDSCPAPSSTRTGLLDYQVCISGHSVSNHPMRPRLPAMLLAPGGLDLRFALSGCRRFFGLRTLLAVSSVASGRIEFVSRAMRPVSSTDYPFVSSCSPRPVARTQLLSTRGGKHRHRGTSTLLCTLLLKRTSAGVSLAVGCVPRPTPSRLLTQGLEGGWNVFDGTPNTATGTFALPNPCTLVEGSTDNVEEALLFCSRL
jgi:hypothetical protein